MIKIDLWVEPGLYDDHYYYTEYREKRPCTSEEATEKPAWYDSEIKELTRIHSVSPEVARKMLRRLIMGFKAVHICTWGEAYECYNLERCHRIDRDMLIEWAIEEGKTHEEAVNLADNNCSLFP